MSRDQRTRILFHVPQLTTGGTERHVASIVRNLDTDRFEPTVWCSGELGPPADDIRAAGVRLETWSRPTKRHPMAFVTTARRIRLARPHIFHSFDYGAHYSDALMSWIGRSGIYVSSRRNVRHWDPDQTLKFGERMRNKISRSVVVNSNAVAEKVRSVELISDSKIELIHTGTDGVVSELSRDDVRKKFGLSSDAFVVANVANLKLVKNQSQLLHALQIVGEAGVDAHLIIAGEGELREALTELARELGITRRLHLVGDEHHVADVLATADVYGHSSLAEGLPTAVIEAMWAGLPVVATRAGGTEDLVVDGQTGRLIDLGIESTAEIASAFQDLALNRSKLRSLGDAGVKFAAENFSTEMMIGKYESFYGSLMS